jgi:hypothetical protein
MDTSDAPSNFADLNDSALLTWRARTGAELERLPPGRGTA